MIVKKLDTHYEVEMFNVVVLNKDNPKESWLHYIAEITKEFEREITRTQYNLNIAPVQSHIIIPDKSEGEKGILDAIKQNHDFV